MAEKRTAKPTPRGPGRLEAVDWVNAALTELANSGIAGVRVESLARKLGVTKGSFYWHFRDRDALLGEMLQTWRRRSTLSVMDRLGSRGLSAKERLQGLLAFPFDSPRAPEGADVELAIRLWGRKDERARSALNEVDELRMRHIVSIFAEMGFDETQAEARAALIYGFMRVGVSLPLRKTVKKIIAEIGTTLG